MISPKRSHNVIDMDSPACITICRSPWVWFRKGHVSLIYPNTRLRRVAMSMAWRMWNWIRGKIRQGQNIVNGCTV